jgi:hypothetical protein
MQQAVVVAVMVDGTAIVARVAGFDAFLAVVLPLLADRDVARLSWTVETPGPAAAPALRPQAA